MTIRSSVLLSALILSWTGLLACGGSEPTRSVQFPDGLLDMAISESWVLEETTDEGRLYVHTEVGDLRLHVSARMEDYGHPLRVLDVKSLVGKELNREYGGISSRVSLGGNAMIKYSRLLPDEGGHEVYAEEWVIAKPVAHSHVARIEISLRMPIGSQAEPTIAGIIDGLDKRVGDARIPKA